MGIVEEVWMPVVGWENAYEVSNRGNVRSIDRLVNSKNNTKALRKGKMLKSKIDKYGYVIYSLISPRKKSYVGAHRLVAMAFITNKENKPTVNHIDGNKLNNNIGNLEWATWTENNRHARSTGLNISSKGEKHYQAKITEVKALEILTLSKTKTTKEISNQLNISPSIVGKIKRRETWKHLEL